MAKYNQRLTEDELILDQYLSRYRIMVRNKHSLERRRDEILKEFESPLSAVNYDGMPRGNSIGSGSAAISYRLDEIDTQITDQAARAAETLIEMIDIIDLLPEHSVERSIIEHKYIDRMRWWQICTEINMSRTPATNHWKKGLNYLLQFEKVAMIIKENSKNKKEYKRVQKGVL